ncbi:isochorismatase family protein [Snodgrassella alvi]|uniref:isochorismatase family protein n=1 Tax=Snodgrassella alvi TaxID=1196083 RepID=UPI00345F7507
MLLDSKRSAVLIIDLQTRLLPALNNTEELLANNIWLAGLAHDMAIPTLISEHCVDKIGATREEIITAAPQARIVQKQSFSVYAAGVLNEDSLQQANQIIISGIEAHICVLQTALDLRAHGYEVFVVADAVSSRKPEDVKLGLARMQAAGCEIVSREMIAFEWLGSANNPLFRDIHKKYIR